MIAPDDPILLHARLCLGSGDLSTGTGGGGRPLSVTERTVQMVQFDVIMPVGSINFAAILARPRVSPSTNDGSFAECQLAHELSGSWSSRSVSDAASTLPDHTVSGKFEASPCCQLAPSKSDLGTAVRCTIMMPAQCAYSLELSEHGQCRKVEVASIIYGCHSGGLIPALHICLRYVHRASSVAPKSAEGHPCKPMHDRHRSDSDSGCVDSRLCDLMCGPSRMQALPILNALKSSVILFL